MNTNLRRAATAVVATALGATALAACGGSGDKADGSKTATPSKTVTLVSHDSFAASPAVLKEFTKETGYTVKVLAGGDAGAAVNQAILSKGHPQGDVFFGVDNTLLSRALDNDLFTPYEAKGLDQVPAALQLDKDKHRVTPVDSGDVCVNYDRKYFAAHQLAVPATFDDLIKPEYKNLLVTENSATSSPGLAFQLGTIAKYGDGGTSQGGASGGGWQDYWKKLKANGVEVVDGWEQAYNDRFSGSAGGKGKGDKPLVVSYASSPPAEVLGVTPQPAQGPTGVATGTCFRQIEFAGLLKGGKNDAGGKALLDFLLSKTFQQDMPLQMFVNPARQDAALPAEFTKYGVKIDAPPTVAPDEIAKNRDQWVKTWSSLVLK
ncbi:thiamine ABC transporter substrate-binding protein [Streptomyces sp. SID13666]|uniref:thiamine ABC transporter substrate-binding protein n=1 Tax=Streptomyces TaxID=1883 RepID=UPI0011064BDE|nr:MULTISPECIES: thiamine ABC transporter substrate-binding protein [Streptomyces]MCZ4100918.1 thiamine ABC transporter substrate-binding protein [Streptomyces sp. H39-C1]NEA59687.1 thiamine ABC transporter substrate-binding protein [Streptomyces sp. SID13666]NEA76517.1 thiamine ABC transporter substrate-binding protein [Streptomyces sp. SID13588]QNA75630.1 thiamine ABC transporter substrate-binding protein [Streptomyces sp. So13.3]